MAPAHVLEMCPALPDVQLIVVVVVLIVRAVHQRRRVLAGHALLLVYGRAGPAVVLLGEGHAALGLPPRDAASQLPYLVDKVYAIGRLGVLGADVQVEMPSQARRGEGLAAERAVFVLCCLQLGPLGGGAGRRGLCIAHGALQTR